MPQEEDLTGEFFMSGDDACAEGAICAGCRFFAGYPITPATEIAERMSGRMPEVEVHDCTKIIKKKRTYFVK